MEYVPVLDVKVSAISKSDLVRSIAVAFKEKKDLTIFHHNLHSVYLLNVAKNLKAGYELPELIVIDGWPILTMVNLGRLKRRQRLLGPQFRFGSTDWIPEVLEAKFLKKVAVLGATDESNRRFIETMSASFPQISFLGIPADPWNREKSEEVFRTICAFSPQLTIVGLGMPLQELTCIRLRSAGLKGTLATVGGAIDQIAGIQKTAPYWTKTLRVEWAWRLINNPRRLSYRYLIEPVKLLALILKKFFLHAHR